MRTPNRQNRPHSHRPRQDRSIRLSHTLISVATIMLLGGSYWTAQPALAQNSTPQQDSTDIRIHTQPLASALTEISRQTGVPIFANGELLQNQQAPAITGRLTAQQAVSQALAGSGLQTISNGQASITIVPSATPAGTTYPPSVPTEESSTQSLDEVTVSATADSHEQRLLDSYYAPESRTYLDEAYIQRFKGTNAADMFFGLPGVGSADTRNGNAVSVNIRGIEGLGRVPLTVDGTEQSTVVYRGYAGHINRNYIDPNLISSTEIIKGPTISTDFRSGTGGAVAMQTIGVNDIVQPEQTFGLRVTGSINNNSVAPRISAPLNSPGLTPQFPAHPTTGNPIAGAYYFQPMQNSSGQSGNFRDYSGSIAAGWRTEQADAVLALSQRKQGNYFSGKKGAHRYQDFATLSDIDSLRDQEWTQGFLTRLNVPGEEVPNTSSETTTILAKGNLKISPDQSLKASYRYTSSDFGSIMPSHYKRISNAGGETDALGLPQEPLSEYRMHAATLNWNLNPANNPYLNLDIGLWANRTRMEGREGASAIGQQLTEYHRDPETGRLVFHPIINPDTGSPLYEDDVAYPNLNNRWGIDLSNSAHISDNLKINLGINFQSEQARPGEYSAYQKYMSDRIIYDSFSQLRDGERKLSEAKVTAHWTPARWIEISAGINYQRHNWQDDYLRKNLESGTGYTSMNNQWIGLDLKSFFVSGTKNTDGSVTWGTNIGSAIHGVGDAIQSFSGVTGGISTQELMNMFIWKPREDGKFYQEDRINKMNELENMIDQWYKNLPPIHENPVYERYVSRYGKEKAEELLNIPRNSLLIRQATQEEIHQHAITSAYNTSPMAIYPTLYHVGTFSGEENIYTPPTKGREDAWGGMIATTLHFNDFLSGYIRYANQPRLPNLFESLYGFSSFSNRPAAYGFTTNKHKPERTHNLEIGSTYDLSRWLSGSKQGLAKISWYDMRSTNFKTSYADRGYVDEIKTRGIELQGNIDSGNWFANIGINYNQSFEVCDQLLGFRYYGFDDRYECVPHGHNRDLRFLKPPKKTINLGLGTRLIERKLTLGTRLTYVDGHSNRPGAIGYEGMELFYDTLNGGASLASIYSPSVTVVDLYASYQFTKNLSLDATVTNATDRYYIEPYNRTKMPAPGRSITFTLKGTF